MSVRRAGQMEAKRGDFGPGVGRFAALGSPNSLADEKGRTSGALG
jgi:hypothetical protein